MTHTLSHINVTQEWKEGKYWQFFLPTISLENGMLHIIAHVNKAVTFQNLMRFDAPSSRRCHNVKHLG